MPREMNFTVVDFIAVLMDINKFVYIYITTNILPQPSVYGHRCIYIIIELIIK